MNTSDITLPHEAGPGPGIKPKTGITLQQYKDTAALLRCEVPAIMAVDQVESQGSGFLPDGKIKILFEPHIFWQRLKKHGLNPVELQKGNEDILYPTWKPGAYGLMSAQHGRLERAAAIHKAAAYESCSWGRYQIMGFNCKSCGFDDAISFVNSMLFDEGVHLENFAKYIISAKLDDELRSKMWDAFAEGYNGPAYKKNNYDTKLASAYASANDRLAKMT